jgi:hypothetical protein
MIADYGGRVIDTAGILAELGSVVNAVQCAIVIQETIAKPQRRNRGASTMGRSQRDCTTASTASR